jgi:Icc-related predicted phosphoesterase
MKVLIFSDIHGNTRQLEKLVATPADVYIAAGDLSNFGKTLDRCGEIMKPLGSRAWILPGNHETHKQTSALCEKFGFTDFHRKKLQVGKSHWAGLGYSNITPFQTPGEYTEEEIAKALAEFEGIEKLNLVVHFPPLDTKLDEFAPGKHAGSATLRKWVEKNTPATLFCGHIHETAGLSDTLGLTACRNVGPEGFSLEV